MRKVMSGMLLLLLGCEGTADHSHDELEQQLAELQGDITALQEADEALDGRLLEAEMAIVDIQLDLIEVWNELAALDGRVSVLEADKVTLPMVEAVIADLLGDFIWERDAPDVVTQTYSNASVRGTGGRSTPTVVFPYAAPDGIPCDYALLEIAVSLETTRNESTGTVYFYADSTRAYPSGASTYVRISDSYHPEGAYFSASGTTQQLWVRTGGAAEGLTSSSFAGEWDEVDWTITQLGCITR